MGAEFKGLKCLHAFVAAQCCSNIVFKQSLNPQDLCSVLFRNHLTELVFCTLENLPHRTCALYSGESITQNLFCTF